MKLIELRFPYYAATVRSRVVVDDEEVILVDFWTKDWKGRHFSELREWVLNKGGDVAEVDSVYRHSVVLECDRCGKKFKWSEKIFKAFQENSEYEFCPECYEDFKKWVKHEECS